MKKLLLLPLLSILCFTAFSQGDIKNASFINVAWNKPFMNYGEQLDRSSSENLYKTYRNQHADFKHMGGSLEFGTSFYIHPTGIIKGFKAGVLVDFIDLGINYMTFTDSTIQLANPTNFYETRSCMDLTARYSLNIGAIVTYSPVKNFYFDLYAKFRPTFAVNYFSEPMFEKGTVKFNDKISTNDQAIIYPGGTLAYHKPMKEHTGTGFGFNSSFGFNVRYAKLNLGMEFILGSIKYKYGEIYMDQSVFDQYLKVKVGYYLTDK